MKRFRGFTLSELLIALAILGVIATFTIPKVLQSQTDSKKKSMAKEVAASLSQALQQYTLDGKLTPSTNSPALTPYLNYVRLYTTPIDDHAGNGQVDCSSVTCLLLHNGGVLAAKTASCGAGFNGTTSLNAIEFVFDPDASYSGSTTGSGKGVQFHLYYNGAVTTRGTVKDNTTCGGPFGPDSTLDPSWFSWN